MPILFLLLCTRNFADRCLTELVSKLEHFENEFKNRDDVDTDKNDCPRVVVVGGGVAGCELALAMRTRHHHHFKNANVTLIGGSLDDLGSGGPRLSSSLHSALSAQHVAVVGGHADKIDEKYVYVDEETTDPIPYDCVLWAAGCDFFC